MKPRTSLREIQEQEAADRQEEEFLRWWAAEEERIQRNSTSEQRQDLQESNRRGKSMGGRSNARGRENARKAKSRDNKPGLLPGSVSVHGS